LNSLAFLLDDTYITFQAAKHFATGHGLVFNVGEKYLSTSAPLYAIILGILGIPNPNAIPTIAIVLFFIATLATATAFIALGKLVNQKVWGVAAAAIYISIPMVWISIGFENTSQVAFIAWAIYFYLKARQQDKPAYAAAVCLALAAMIRPDGIVAAGAVLIESLSRAIYKSIKNKQSLNRAIQTETKTLNAKAVLLYIALLIAFYSGISLYFGSPLPGTMAAKIAQAQGGGMQLFLPGAIAWVQSLGHYYKPLFIIIALAAIGIIPGVKNPAVRILALFAILHTLAYQIAGIPFFGWYVVPECVAVAALAAQGVSVLLHFVTRARQLRIVALSGAGIGLLALIASSYAFAQTYYGMNPVHSKSVAASRLWMYPRVAEWLRTNTNTTDRVGYYEVGEIGWLSDRPFIDPVGLVTANQENDILARNYDAVYQRLGPEIVLCLQRQSSTGSWDSEYGLDPDKKDWFNACYKQVDEIDNIPFRVAIFQKQIDYQDWRKSMLEKLDLRRPAVSRAQ
jgi:hypothetical protein